LRGGGKEQIIDRARVAARPRIELMRQGEDHLKIFNRQQLGFALRRPQQLFVWLAFRAMAIATRVIGDAWLPAIRTRLGMAAHRGSATAEDGT
jgi:hypothetical protein